MGTILIENPVDLEIEGPTFDVKGLWRLKVDTLNLQIFLRDFPLERSQKQPGCLPVASDLSYTLKQIIEKPVVFFTAGLMGLASATICAE